jgi:DNA-binding NarL/FixJ family response regulator
METVITVLLADDHALLRAGLRAILASQPDICVLAEASDGREALRLAEEIRPTVILLDISMPGLNGLETLLRLREAAPSSAVVILSMHKVEEYAARALRAGALGYVLKDSPPSILLAAVRAAARGERYLAPPLDFAVIEEYQRRLGQEGDLLESLTPREREILQLLAEGHTTQAIASLLAISPKTVETHRAHLMDKLGVYDIASLTRLAIRAGLVSG